MSCLRVALYTRHSVVVAQMAATMQHASAVEECVTILRGLIAGERTSASGTAFQIDAMLLRTRPPEIPVPIYLAAIGPPGWESAMRVADGIATVWSDTLAETRKQFMREHMLPTAVLIPFAQSRHDFFTHRLTCLADLRQRVASLAHAGCDEAIVAYADMADLETAAQLLR